MSNSWLTIITITKDDANGLARTLASAAKLRATGAEHLVIDGSKDMTRAAQLAAQAGQGIRYLARIPQGVADAFNIGLTEASGDWIWFLNGGDTVHEQLDAGWLHSLLAATQAHVVTGAIHFDGEPTPRSIPHLSYQWPLLACWLAHPASLVRREKLRAVNGFETRWRIASDYDLWFRSLGRDMAVDVIAVPFARFDVEGISQRSSSRPLARYEDAKVIVVHSVGLVREGIWLGLRIIRRILWAVGYLVSHRTLK